VTTSTAQRTRFCKTLGLQLWAKSRVWRLIPTLSAPTRGSLDLDGASGLLFGCFLYVLAPALAVLILLIIARVIYRWHDSNR